MKDLLFEQQRTTAFTVECDDCKAGIGEPCVYLGSLPARIPLQHQPAHFVRLMASGAVGTSREVARR